MGAILTSISWIFFNAGISSVSETSVPSKVSKSATNTILASPAAACMVIVAKPIFNIFGKEEGSTFDPATLMSC